MRGRRAGLMLSMLLGSWPLAALAVGGDDVNTSTKVNAATQACQAEIAKKGAAFASATAKSVNDCLDAIVKCDEQSTAEKALACRRGLLRPGSGKCAVGKLDEGASLTGTGAAAHADSLSATSKAALIKAMNTYNAALQKKCFDAAGVDLASVSIGLGFSPAPASKLQLSDATNANPGGVGCLANGLVLQTHPLADDIVSVLDPLHETCVASSDPLELGTACTSNGDCGASGVCGKLARVVRDGSIEECQGPAPECGDAEIGFPETCDDGNVASGDGCSSSCAVEVVCGDGFSIEPEACDDGNVANGDGCSSLCAIEPPGPSQLFPASGQTTCWDPADVTVPIATIPCAGTGQDGDLQFGATLSYTDNGDGTITDNNTGLMWEKLSDDGSIHDKDTSYTWANAFAVKIATLNAGGGFAGHTDWRLPNMKELQSIVDYQIAYPGPTVNPVFNTGCVPSATVLTGSCTLSNYYWSSSSYVFTPHNAWIVYFDSGNVNANYKTLYYYVRAVRGGS